MKVNWHPAPSYHPFSAGCITLMDVNWHRVITIAAVLGLLVGVLMSVVKQAELNATRASQEAANLYSETLLWHARCKACYWRGVVDTDRIWLARFGKVKK